MHLRKIVNKIDVVLLFENVTVFGLQNTLVIYLSYFVRKLLIFYAEANRLCQVFDIDKEVRTLRIKFFCFFV